MPLSRFRVYKKLGRQGCILILVAFIWVTIGISLLDPGYTVRSGDSVFTDLINPPIRGVLWLLTGLIAGACAFVRKPKPWAVGLIIFMPLIAGVSYFWSFLMYVIPGIPEGLRNGLYASVFYLAMTALVFIGATERER